MHQIVVQCYISIPFVYTGKPYTRHKMKELVDYAPNTCGNGYLNERKISWTDVCKTGYEIKSLCHRGRLSDSIRGCMSL